MSDIKIIINPGLVPCNGRMVNLFCRIEIKRKNGLNCLSISGVEGPSGGGNASGSCGQIEIGYWHKNPDHNDERYTNPTRPNRIKFSEGWDKDKWLEFLEIWHDWHMNDMRAYCKHQKKLGWNPSQKVTIYHYRLDKETCAIRKQAEKEALEAMRAGQTHTAGPTQVQMLQLQANIKSLSPEPPPHYTPNTPRCSGDTYNRPSETKTAGWIDFNELPEIGLLGRPCPACGYKYGHAWMTEPVPQNKLEFLLSLPPTTINPAWV